MNGLTLLQTQVLKLIDESVRYRGYPPAISELRKRLPCTTHAYILIAVKTLENSGFLQKDSEARRSYILTNHGRKAITPQYYIFDESANPLQICRD